jgi:hypothetical protein
MYKPRNFLALSIKLILMIFLMSLSPLEDLLRKVQIKEYVNIEFIS